MFCVIYQFHVIPGLEEQFITGWTAITEHYKRSKNSLGSHLFLESKGLYTAIALWPDLATWAGLEGPSTEQVEEARTMMRRACSEVNTIHQLEGVSNLWKHTLHT